MLQFFVVRVYQPYSIIEVGCVCVCFWLKNLNLHSFDLFVLYSTAVTDVVVLDFRRLQVQLRANLRALLHSISKHLLDLRQGACRQHDMIRKAEISES